MVQTLMLYTLLPYDVSFIYLNLNDKTKLSF